MVMYLGKVVEIGPAKAVFNEPLHPYTHPLVAAIPSHCQRRTQRVYLAGELRSPIDPDPQARRSSKPMVPSAWPPAIFLSLMSNRIRLEA